MEHAGGDGRRDGITVCIAMEMNGEEGENKNNTRLQQTPAEGGSLLKWLKFIIRIRSEKMKKSNEDEQVWLGRHEAGCSCWRGCW